jgi:Tfp pilus assembly protein PilO
MRGRGREYYIIAVVVALVLTGVWYFLLFSPMNAKLADLDTQIETQQQAQVTARQEIARLESYKKTAPQSRAEIVRLGKMLPESEGIPSLIIELTRTADTSGVDLLNITRGTTVTGTPYGVQSITIQVVGGFFDVQDFVYRLENYVAFRNASFRVTGRLFDIQNLAIQGGAAASGSSTSLVTTNIILNAYLWGQPANGGAQ